VIEGILCLYLLNRDLVSVLISIWLVCSERCCVHHELLRCHHIDSCFEWAAPTVSSAWV